MLKGLYIFGVPVYHENVKRFLHCGGGLMKKIFTKADEMELAINYKAARNAFVFLEFALAIYCLVCVIKTGELPWAWLIFIISGVVFWGTKLIETKRLTDPGDSDEE